MLSASSPLCPSADENVCKPPKITVKSASRPILPPVVVTTRRAWKAQLEEQSLSSTSTSFSSFPPCSSSPPTSERSSVPPSPPRKRKSPLPRQEEPGLEDAESSSAPELKRPKTTSKKGKGTKGVKRQHHKWSEKMHLPRLPTRPNSSLAPSIYRNSRSRSTSAFPNHPFKQRIWRTDETTGYPGEQFLSSEMVVKSLMKTYKPFFKNPNDKSDTTFEPHPDKYPVVELEFPYCDAAERFILLAPKDPDHYNPVYDLEKTLCTVIEHYCTPEQQAKFGNNPNDWREDWTDSYESLPLASPSPSSSSSSVSSQPETPLIRRFKRAIHFEDGPAFLEVMDSINELLRSFKYPPPPDDIMQAGQTNLLMLAPDTWTETGLPKGVLMRLLDENYQRTVGPNVPKLKRYEAFSSTVYGELMPSLVDEIIQVTGLNEDSLFLDLGSGVANIVVQASLQTGCKSFGIELMPEPARVAEDVVRQMQIRCRMWGLKMGEVELEKGDMLKSKRVDELMPKADVVLVDNKVFEESLNEALKPKFLDLKEGAIIVSLAPFVTSINGRVTDRNVDDPMSIFDVEERKYASGSVSWGHSGGSYYVHRVDRQGYADMREKFEKVREQIRPQRKTRGKTSS